MKKYLVLASLIAFYSGMFALAYGTDTVQNIGLVAVLGGCVTFMGVLLTTNPEEIADRHRYFND